MNPVGKTLDEESQRAIEEYLKNGGTITQCEPNARTENIEYTGGMWGRRKKAPTEESKQDGE